MQFISTRGRAKVDCASRAISQGLADDGGLYVPEKFPSVNVGEMLSMDYAERACFVLKQYLTEYDEKELLSACKSAYGNTCF